MHNIKTTRNCGRTGSYADEITKHMNKISLLWTGNTKYETGFEFEMHGMPLKTLNTLHCFCCRLFILHVYAKYNRCCEYSCSSWWLGMDREERVFTQPAAGQTAYDHSHREGKLRNFDRVHWEEYSRVHVTWPSTCLTIHFVQLRSKYPWLISYRR